MNLEDAVRTAVRDLAEEGRPVNLAAGALRRGRRLRLRRRALTGAAALVAVAALAVPYLVARANPAAPDHRPAAPPSSARPVPPSGSPVPSAPPTLSGPVALADGWILGSVPAPDSVYVYDRSARLYRRLPYRFAAPAPTGNLVAVWERGRIGVVDLATDAVRWVDRDDASILPPHPWSRDGARIAYTTGDSAEMDGTTRIVVVEAATAQARTLPAKVRCGDGCFPTWLPDGRVGMDLPGPSPRGVQTYRADDGRDAGVVALPGWVGQGSPWSPDGGRVVLLMPDGSTSGPLPRALVEVASGRNLGPVQTRGDVYWTAPDRMLVVTSDGVAHVAADGTRLSFYPRPEQFAGSQEWSEATVVRA